MPSQLFYIWPPKEADDEALAKGRSVIAALQSDTVTITPVEGGYSVTVTGQTLRASNYESRKVVAPRLQNEGGFYVGRAIPVRGESVLLQPPRVAPVAPPPEQPEPPQNPKRKYQRSKPLRPPTVGTVIVTRDVASSPDPHSKPVMQPQTRQLLEFMRTSPLHEMKLSFIYSRLQMSRQALKDHMRILIDLGYAEELRGAVYRLTDKVRQTDGGEPTGNA